MAPATVPVSVPELIVRPPVSVLAFERVSVPEPFFVRTPAPLMMPLSVWDAMPAISSVPALIVVAPL